MNTLTLSQLWDHFEPSSEEEETVWFIKDGVKILLNGDKSIISLEYQSDELYITFDMDELDDMDDMDLLVEGDEVFTVMIIKK